MQDSPERFNDFIPRGSNEIFVIRNFLIACPLLEQHSRSLPDGGENPFKRNVYRCGNCVRSDQEFQAVSNDSPAAAEIDLIE